MAYFPTSPVVEIRDVLYQYRSFIKSSVSIRAARYFNLLQGTIATTYKTAGDTSAAEGPSTRREQVLQAQRCVRLPMASPRAYTSTFTVASVTSPFSVFH